MSSDLEPPKGTPEWRRWRGRQGAKAKWDKRPPGSKERTDATAKARQAHESKFDSPEAKAEHFAELGRRRWAIHGTVPKGTSGAIVNRLTSLRQHAVDGSVSVEEVDALIDLIVR